MSSSRNNNEKLKLKNKLDEVREQIQERTNYIKQLDQVQENHEYDSRRDRFDASNQINGLKDKETKLEDESIKRVLVTTIF
ncbi:hypothetical protein RDI58_014550 [Solanum bulbocastanum]|uniref:Uncharacterized protein n=1 Tax=Solanum bulbocastanum TaxID=147425 RepID=A0AAN8YAN7_SOLBU